MIHEKMESVTTALAALAGKVSPELWDEVRSAIRVLGQAAEDVKILEKSFVPFRVVALVTAAEAPRVMQ